MRIRAARLDRDFRLQLEGRLATSLPRASLLAYVEFVTCDETPMKVGVSEINVLSDVSN